MEETFAQFTYRLGTYLNYYLESRKVVKSYERLRKLLISDKLKLTLSPGMWNQARLAEKGKWIDPPELAETLDNYVADVADMNYSKNSYQRKNKGKIFFRKSDNDNERKDAQNNSSSAVNQDSETNKKENKNVSLSSQQKGARYGSNESAQGQIVRPPCVHCKQEIPTHSPLRCWKNPNGPEFRTVYHSNRK